MKKRFMTIGMALVACLAVLFAAVKTEVRMYVHQKGNAWNTTVNSVDSVKFRNDEVDGKMVERMHVFRKGEAAAWSAATANVDSVNFQIDTLRYLVTFMDGKTMVSAKKYDYGTMPECELPVKEDLRLKTYDFFWNPKLTVVVGETTYTLDSTYIYYKYRFVDYDGKTLKDTAATYSYEPKVSILPIITKDSVFTFKAWLRDEGKIADSIITLTAQYDSTLRKYTCEFYNCDTLFATVKDCAYDSVVTAVPRTSTEEYNYVYRWSIDESKMKNDTLIYTAVCDSFLTKKNGVIRAAAYKISETDSVYFSQGNLQFNAAQGSHATADGTAQGTWRFAENQYDVVGDGNANIAEGYDGWIDLFGWGTSGWNGGAKAYQPWTTAPTWTDYSPGGSVSNNLTGDYANADWGVYNAISNGGNEPNQWRTLTNAEWIYLFQNNKWTLGYIKDGSNSYLCFMLIPESFTAPEGITVEVIGTADLTSTSMKLTVPTTNTYTTEQFASLEKLGVVAFPYAGYRVDTSVYDVGSYGHYWSSSVYNYGSAYIFCFRPGTVDSSFGINRDEGNSVRLVYDLNLDIRFVNADGTTLLDTTVARGATPTYTRGVPTKDSTDYAYQFKGWNKEIVEAESDMVYTAVYDSSFIMKKNGAIRCAYRISATDSVYFSQGNLQFNAVQGKHATADSTAQGTWRFAENQYDYIGSANKNTSETYNGWIDLFSWGTSGWNSGANAYQPWSTSEINSNYYPGGSDSNNLTGDYAKADWGVYNAISNGGDEPNNWRTLTTNEWEYLFKNNKWTLGTVKTTAEDSILCFMLIPADFTAPDGINIDVVGTGGLSDDYMDMSESSYSNNTYTVEQFSQIEKLGVVALPCAGRRYGASVRIVGSYGLYWSSSASNFGNAGSFYFHSTRVESSSIDKRGSGYNIRLVQNLNLDIHFVNADGTTLLDTTVARGATPTYTREKPTMDSTKAYRFEFIGWDKEIVSAENDMVYTAVYDSISVRYTSVFKDYAGTMIKTVEKCPYDSVLNGKELNHRDAYYRYDFNGWSRDESKIALDSLVYTAVYDTTKILYTRLYYNCDTLFKKIDSCAYDSVVTLVPPTRTSTEEYNYDVYRWSIDESKIGKDTLIYTAVCDSFLTKKNGAIRAAAYKISATDSVYFSQGNLQFNAMQGSHKTADSTAKGTWRFAENQWDVIGAGNADIAENYDGWIDLISWGTSGWNSGANAYQPWSTSTSGEDYCPGNNLTGDYAKADWGVYNAISNGGNEPNQWRTLTTDEWQYLFKNNKWTLGYIEDGGNSYSCFMLIPETFTAPEGINIDVVGTGNLSETVMRDISESIYSNNTYTVEQFSQIEKLGVVALPCAGYRYDTSLVDVGSYGHYWSSSALNSYFALNFYFNSSGVVSNYFDHRSYGNSVRLVQNLNLDIHFVNADGTTLLDTTVARGATPEYTRKDPTMNPSKTHTYKFTGWNEVFSAADKDMTYTAQYASTLRKYTCEFYNCDTLFATVKDCAYDSVPKLATPTCVSSEDYTYEFKGWSKDTSKIEKDTLIYTAVYDSTFIMKKNGAIRCAYKISATDSVYFSQGNLQFNAMQGSHKTADSTAKGTWRFAENQWDVIGAGNADIAENYDGWIDLISWGTSGWNSGANAYQPWSTSTSGEDYCPGNNLTGDYAKADWGVYNAISNGGNEPNQWRTLTTDEWQYLFKNNKWTLGYIEDGGNSYSCFMLIPETFTAPEGINIDVVGTGNLSETVMRDISESIYSNNTYTVEQFSQIEKLGVVVLPCGGVHFGMHIIKVGLKGDYWSSSAADGSANNFAFESERVLANSQVSKYLGLSVRLVQDVQ